MTRKLPKSKGIRAALEVTSATGLARIVEAPRMRAHNCQYCIIGTAAGVRDERSWIERFSDARAQYRMVLGDRSRLFSVTLFESRYSRLSVRIGDEAAQALIQERARRLYAERRLAVFGAEPIEAVTV